MRKDAEVVDAVSDTEEVAGVAGFKLAESSILSFSEFYNSNLKHVMGKFFDQMICLNLPLPPCYKFMRTKCAACWLYSD